MKCSVEVGEELMPQRNEVNISSNSEVDPPSGESQAVVSTTHTSEIDTPSGESQAAVSTTHIRKLCRNRGLVLQEQSVVEDSPETEQSPVVEDSPHCDL
jgi:hypothetical protein